MSTPTVLFLCQHNAGRSQLGAALLEILAPGEFTVASAGITPADSVHPAVAATIAELGLDIQRPDPPRGHTRGSRGSGHRHRDEARTDPAFGACRSVP